MSRFYCGDSQRFSRLLLRIFFFFSLSFLFFLFEISTLRCEYKEIERDWQTCFALSRFDLIDKTSLCYFSLPKIHHLSTNTQEKKKIQNFKTLRNRRIQIILISIYCDRTSNKIPKGEKRRESKLGENTNRMEFESTCIVLERSRIQQRYPRKESRIRGWMDGITIAQRRISGFRGVNSRKPLVDLLIDRRHRAIRSRLFIRALIKRRAGSRLIMRLSIGVHADRCACLGLVTRGEGIHFLIRRCIVTVVPSFDRIRFRSGGNMRGKRLWRNGRNIASLIIILCFLVEFTALRLDL